MRIFFATLNVILFKMTAGNRPQNLVLFGLFSETIEMLNLLPWWRRRCSGESNAATCPATRCSARSWGTTTSATPSSSPCEAIRGGILIPSHAPWRRLCLWSSVFRPPTILVFSCLPTTLPVLRRLSSPLCGISSHHTKPRRSTTWSSTFHWYAIGLARQDILVVAEVVVQSALVFLGEPKTEEYRHRRPESYSLLVLLPRAFTGTTTSLMKIL